MNIEKPARYIMSTVYDVINMAAAGTIGMMFSSLALGSVIFLQLVGGISGRGADKTLQRDAAGADVVRAVLSKLDNFNESFSSQTERQVYEQFIRESAYVESFDGATYPSHNHDGGIWKVSEDIFQQTQQSNSSELFGEICNIFCIDWLSVDYSDLRIPLYSGLAMRIYLFHLRNRGLTLHDYALDEERAEFWVEYFGGHKTISIWLTRVYHLRNIEVCRVDTDVVFVIDSSGSIGAGNYQTVKEYVYNFTEGLLSGDADSRVGLIVYSNTATVDIPLNFTEEAALLYEIEHLNYISGSTNTPEALCLLKTVGWRESVSVQRSAVVLTDGMSNEYSSGCHTSTGQSGTVSSTAEEVHNLDPPVTVFAVGVAGYNIDELQIIATSPDLVDTLASFDYRLLLQNQQSRTYFICYKKSQPVRTGEEQVGVISMGSVSRLQFSGPGSEGVTVRICVELGVIVIYGSYTIPNPSAALHDFRKVLGLEVGVEGCLTSHVTLDDASNENRCTLCGPASSRNKRQAGREETVTVYVTIEGMSELESQFSVNSSFGSAFECAADYCGENAVLVQTNGSCSCECKEGYKGDGHDCIECGADYCGENAVLVQTNGSCSCECKEGYKGDGHECIIVHGSDKSFIVAIGVVATVCLLTLVLQVLVVVFYFKCKKIKYVKSRNANYNLLV